MHTKKALGGLALLLLVAAGFSGCGGVNIATESNMPTPLVDQIPVTVGIYYSDDFAKATHAEERWGTDWKVDLGPYHVHMADKLFAAEFRETVAVTDIKSLPQDPPYKAILEPRIEQFSFITPRDTGAKYFAVTIRYRLNVYAPNGTLADSLTFTGYGSNGAGSGMTSTKPMIAATKAAMRDAAAKFLVQFPEQDVAKRLIAGEPLVEAKQQVALGGAAGAGAAAGASDSVKVDTVPIVDPTPETAAPGAVPGQPAPARAPAGTTTPAAGGQAPSTDAPKPPAESQPTTDQPSSPTPSGSETPPTRTTGGETPTPPSAGDAKTPPGADNKTPASGGDSPPPSTQPPN